MDSRPALLLKALRKDLIASFPHMRELLNEKEVVPLNADDFAAHALYHSMFKKWVPKDTSKVSNLATTAITRFLACNSKCADWVPPDAGTFEFDVYKEIQQQCYEDFNDVDISWSEIFARARMGPGSSIGSLGQNSHLEKLFLNRMSTDSLPLYKEYEATLVEHPILHAAEKRRKEIRGRNHLRLVKGSNLKTVRKNIGTDRTICTEASLNMYAQIGVGEIVNDVLRRLYGYDPEIQQDRNRELARRGSRSGLIATLDLTDSSDLIALLMTQSTLHPLLSCAMADCRSTHTKVQVEGSKKATYVELHMVSSMGNGFTFPVMTYIYTVCLKALCKVLKQKFTRYDVSGTPFGVFGDDICMPASLYEPLCKVLRALGFKPNLDKSFASGPFRESCGGDYYNGKDVRGVYVKKLDSMADEMSAINRLNVWSAKHLVPLPRVVRMLLPRGWTQLVVPLDEQDTAGIKTNWFGNKTHYQCLQPVREHVFIYRVRKGTITGLRRGFDNPMGVLLMTINGSVINGCIARRPRCVTYTTVVKAMPNIWACDNDFGRHCVTLSDWETLTAINLGLSAR